MATSQIPQIINLAGKSALITGASSGIGRSTAVLFRQLGASVIAVARNADRLKELVEECETIKQPGFIHAVSADVTREDDVDSLFTSVQQKFGDKFDILINNAGLLEKGSILETDTKQYDRVMDLNLKAIYNITAKAAQYLINAKGNVVNVSSVNGMRSFPGVLAYNISKAGVDQLTRCVALELAAQGVRVNSVNPGVTVTELHRRSGMDDKAYQSFLDHSKSTHALGRAGQSIEVARAIAFLASDAASFITGVTLPVDGGRHAMCPR
uniref:3-oxoacyl-[acyl-carrier-protein] reductase FabG n=1 Tax=Panagrellus redivivus TaxID=6233 RepID=A0A7E4UNA9_PANRE